MDIPRDLKARLISELNFIIKKIEEEEEARKLYYLSAAHGAIERTMRFCSDNELLIAHAILNLCYSTFLDRYNRIRSGDTVIELPDDWVDTIVGYLSELRDRIAKNESTYPVLEKLMRLTYSVTGPGYYTFGYLESA